ncbi:MAG: Re/Si-specific NAD(P)(+) transhydrogenase subunit alpha [Candidatus Dadabacteria bacterium]|nr:Re/Si-specific NAD(P)(+) transhydrogenase subunit alpha [Candidatus Dadabacteria bacterium]
MKIGIAKETVDGERRVALVPAMVSRLIDNEHVVFVESGAGEGASFSDNDYKEQGAKVIKDPSGLYLDSEVVVKVQPPQTKGKIKEVDFLKDGLVLICFLSPFENPSLIKILATKKVTGFAMEFIPRIARAQSMDALSSMATVVGYKAVLMAADNMGKFFPLLMTAAGTIHPANVLVLGAGVAGLQAIATAKRLGARVEAFDPRPAVKEQIESLGAQFVPMELPEGDVETQEGYAKEMTEEFLKKEQEAIASRLPRVDAIITTAAVFGKRAPVLITEQMVKLMPSGSVIVDIAAGTGGNCELTKPDKVVEKHGVSIFGETNLASALPVHASQMYSGNMLNLLNHLYPKADFELDFEDEIIGGACMTRDGKIVNEMVDQFINNGGE